MVKEWVTSNALKKPYSIKSRHRKLPYEFSLNIILH